MIKFRFALVCTEGLDVPVGSNLGHTLTGVSTGCRKEKVRLASTALLHTEAYRWEV